MLPSDHMVLSSEFFFTTDKNRWKNCWSDQVEKPWERYKTKNPNAHKNKGERKGESDEKNRQIKRERRTADPALCGQRAPTQELHTDRTRPASMFMQFNEGWFHIVSLWQGRKTCSHRPYYCNEFSWLFYTHPNPEAFYTKHPLYLTQRNDIV